MPGNLARSYVGPTLLELVRTAVDDRVALVREHGARSGHFTSTMYDLGQRVAQELILRRQAAASYAEREGATNEIRLVLERDELRAQITDFIAGVLR